MKRLPGLNASSVGGQEAPKSTSKGTVEGIIPLVDYELVEFSSSSNVSSRLFIRAPTSESMEWYGNGDAEALLARSPWGRNPIAAIFEKVVRFVLCDDREPSLETLLSNTLRSIGRARSVGGTAGLSS